MSGFSAEWLSLREPVDHASRNGVVKRAMLNYLITKHGKSLSHLNMIDLGCGTGSNLRAISPFLGRHQNWTLVDYDAQLLTAARETLVEWADEVLTDDNHTLQIKRAENILKIDFLQIDLMQSYGEVLNRQPDLITAAAFFDLVSPDWIIRFTEALKSPLYTVLTYNGNEKWMPPHAVDGAMLKAFIHHQQTNKGFGPAAGPAAAQVLIQALQKVGYVVTEGLSNWVLYQPDHLNLTRMLAKGIAQAVVETGQVDQGDINDWLASRSQALNCEIGHVDIFAAPAS